jgi:hypothetical protein
MLKKVSLLLALLMSGISVPAEDLAYIAPEKVAKVPYKAELRKGGAIKVSLDANSYIIDSMFSTVPGWGRFTDKKAEGFEQVNNDVNNFTAANDSFEIKRKLVLHDEYIEVIDQIKNLTESNLPLMLRHQTELGKLKEYRLCGYRKYGRRGRGSSSANCSAILIPKAGGSLGLLALNDVFRAHFQAYGVKGIYGIADNNLIIKPGFTQVMRWGIFPSDKASYYAQINAMRRLLGVNYVYQGGFAFFAPYPRGVATFAKGIDRVGNEHPDKDISDFIAFRGVKYSTSGPSKSRNEGVHGSAWFYSHNTEAHRDLYKKIKRLQPETTCQHYYHCFLDEKNAMKDDFSGCEVLTSTGKQADYRNPNMPLFCPVIGNKWAKFQEKRLNVLLNEYQVEGIFWDEFGHSAVKTHFGKPWDGVSGDIDPSSHKITCLKSSVTLLSLPWRLKTVEYIASKNKFLIASGGPHTESMQKLFNKNKYIGLVETGSVSHLLEAHLNYPIGLGDHLTERNELDCYRNMVKYLDYGSLYFWYHQQVPPATHKTLTSYMFPITPVELHEGYIIGKERILTNRSGWYSLGDNSDAEAHFFNEDGYEVKRKLDSQIKDDKKYYKIELGEHESCALVKKK